MTSDDLSELIATVSTSELEVPTELVRTNDFNSTTNHPPSETRPSNLRGYEGIDWNRLKGYKVPVDEFRSDVWIWSEGWRLYHTSSDRYYWLCKRCHKQKRLLRNTLKEALYRADLATSGARAHMKSYHKLTSEGPVVANSKESTLDNHIVKNGYDRETERDNEAATEFDQHHFRALLYDWIISDNLSFHQLESDKLRSLLEYLEPRTKGLMPSHQTVSRTIASVYDKVLGLVTDSLNSALTKINISFDLWTSKNKLALLGLCAHYIDNTGKPVTTLLALPRQSGFHSGFNLSETISAIISEFGLSNKVGYITTDNASSNETCLQFISNEFGFEYKPKWLRCSGHVFNLVGQAALLGNNSDAFAKEVEDASLEEIELATWRRRGPIGKRNNIIYWILRSPHRCERLAALELELIAPTRPAGKKEVYDLVRDVETRWNSFDDSAERALYLRLAIDELLLKEKVDYNEYLERCQRRKASPKKAPPILQDALDDNDWHIIKLYHEILKPLRDATKLLQGHAGSRFGAIWQVIPAFEKLLHHFETLVDRYPVKESLKTSDSYYNPSLEVSAGYRAFNTSLTDVADAVASVPDDQTTYEHHLSINIKLAWSKLNEYYAHLDDTPAYVAAIVLHPHMKWRWLEKRWKDAWIKGAKNRFHELVTEYQYAGDAGTDNKAYTSPTQPSPKRRRLAIEFLSDDELSDDDDNHSAQSSIQQQLAEYLKEPRSRELSLTSSPIPYWIAVRWRWPALAAMALDVYAAAVMSDEPERVFSITGAAIGPRRRLLQDDTIKRIMCLKAWRRAGVIEFDRQVYKDTLTLFYLTNRVGRALFTRTRYTSTTFTNTSEPLLPSPALPTSSTGPIAIE